MRPPEPGSREDVLLKTLVAARASVDAAIALLHDGGPPAGQASTDPAVCEHPRAEAVQTMGAIGRFCPDCGETLE